MNDKKIDRKEVLIRSMGLCSEEQRMGILECWKSVCIKYNVNLEEYYDPDMYVGVERFETRCFANFAYSQKEMALQYVREIVPMVTECKLKITFYHPMMKEYNGYGLRRQD